MKEKADLRRSMKNKLSALDPETFKVQGIEAGKLISAESVWKTAKTVLLFMSMEKEIDTHFLLEKALSSGKILFVPRILDDTMAFFRVNSLSGPWEKGAFGILEPEMKNPFHPDQIGFPLLIIVPGLAFDKQGHRLGRGKGYYDSFLSKLKHASGNKNQNITIAGLCLKEQIADHVPAEEYDQKVDAICVENDYIEIE